MGSSGSSAAARELQHQAQPTESLQLARTRLSRDKSLRFVPGHSEKSLKFASGQSAIICRRSDRLNGQQVICEKYDAGHNKWVMKGENSRFLRGEQYRESVVSTNGDHQPALSLEVFGSSVF